MDYECSIELIGSEPKIWRQFQFHADVTFQQLHRIIQIVMGWKKLHPYEFHNEQYLVALPDGTFEETADRKVLNALKEPVRTLLNPENPVISYTYDLDDEWRHTITLVKASSASKSGVPECRDGAGDCPREDGGGDPVPFSIVDVNALLVKEKDRIVPKSLLSKRAGSKASKAEIQPVKLKKPALNQYLKQCSPEQLATLVKECYEISKDVQKFLTVKIMGEESTDALFQECRKKVEQEFFPERGYAKLRLREAKKAISDFEKLTGDARLTLELKMFYVEMGVKLADEWGDMDERFYNSVESVYADVIRTVNADDSAELFEEFEDRLEAVLTITEDMGWGFHDILCQYHFELRWNAD